MPSRRNTRIREIIVKPHGIFLVTGPTGSGKSTSLYAFLSTINSVTKRIITIEEPVEYELKGINQIAVRADIGLTFAMGLRHILRQDPNVIMVGEIRDLETAEIAIRAALTGHLVFSTLHTNDAPSAFTRLIDMGIEPFLVASSVEAVLAQRLVRTICPKCKTEHKGGAGLLDAHRLPGKRDRHHQFLQRGRLRRMPACWATRGAWASTNCSSWMRTSAPLIMTRATSSAIAQQGHGKRHAHLAQRRLEKSQGRQDHHRRSPPRHADRGTPQVPPGRRFFQATRLGERLLMARWQSANLLHTSAAGRHFWQLSAAGDRFAVQSEKALLLNESLPSGAAAKDWQTLFRGKLNIAWLPPDKVFLRAVHLPPGDPAELAQMVELQLEKLSPLPVTHIVWSMLSCCHVRRTNPTPCRPSLSSSPPARRWRSSWGVWKPKAIWPTAWKRRGWINCWRWIMRDEGVWVIAGAPGEPALVAWWYGGTVQNLTLVSLPPGLERGPQLRTQIEQIAWAGELEGWLPGPPKVHLVASRSEAGFWEPVFKDAGEQMEIIAPMAGKELAARTAQRCAGNPATNLLPPEFATRYRQQFVDGLWMRGFFALLSAYIVAVLIYFGMLYALNIKFNHVKQDLTVQGVAFTNALKDHEQFDILQSRNDLKFALLDCWKAAAENLPESISIDNIYFDRAKFELRGTVPTDDNGDVTIFNDAMRHVPDPNRSDKTLFSEVSPPTMNAPAATTTWGFKCTIKEGGQ